MVRKIQLIVNMYVVLKIRYIFYSKVICMAQWLSWLERRPVTAEVESSSLCWVVAENIQHVQFKIFLWGLSSAGRASALQAEGHRFEPYRPHMPQWRNWQTPGT